MTTVTLNDLFADLDGRQFDNRRDFETAVLEVFNQHVSDLPIGYSYVDAIDGARARGWLVTTGGARGVRVHLGDAAPAHSSTA